MVGKHCINTWLKTKAVIAKSSAEAKLYGVIRSATEALGMCSLYKDFGLEMSIQVNIDAAAAKGIIERRGLSKVRHIDVNVLWFQDVCARKILPVDKIPGEDNPADPTTKHLTSQTIAKYVDTMNMTFEEGRANKAAQLHSTVKKKCISGHDDMKNIDNAMSSIGSDKTSAWADIRAAANDVRGGDRWKSRGHDGAGGRFLLHTVCPRVPVKIQD